MNDIRYYINLLDEARSHPELNPKISTYNVIRKYSSSSNANQLYLHFNNIEKVGINLKSSNTFGPFGVYAFPISHFSQSSEKSFNYQIKMNRSRARYLNILQIRPDANVLNLTNLTNEVLEQVYNQVKRIHKKVTHSSNKHYLPLTNNVKHDWRILVSLIGGISSTRDISWQGAFNIVLRQVGYDALYDSSQLLNDNPNQIVFLHTKAFDIVETIPVRLSQNGIV